MVNVGETLNVGKFNLHLFSFRFFFSVLVAIQFELVEYICNSIFLFYKNIFFSNPIRKWGDANLFKVGVLSYVIFVVIAYVFILCEPGARMIKHFEIFEENLSQFDWYLLPIDLQLMYMVFLSETQNGVKISSYGGIVCERNTSKLVRKKMQKKNVQ